MLLFLRIMIMIGYITVYTLSSIMGTSITILRSFLAVAVVVLHTQKNSTNFRHRSPCLIRRLRQGISRGATGHKEHRLRAAPSDCNMDKMVIPRVDGNTAFNGAEQEERRGGKKETEQQVVSSSNSAFCQWIKAVASQSEAPPVCCFPSDGEMKEEENTLPPRAKPKTSSVPTPPPPPKKYTRQTNQVGLKARVDICYFGCINVICGRFQTTKCASPFGGAVSLRIKGSDHSQNVVLLWLQAEYFIR